LILLVAGTHEQPFDRVIEGVEEFARSAGKDLFVQYGYSRPPSSSEGSAFISFEEMRTRMTEADTVVTHGGTGSVMLALSLGRTPIVAPRYRRCGEHIDDHQLELVEKLGEKGLIVPFLPEAGEDAVEDGCRRSADRFRTCYDVARKKERLKGESEGTSGEKTIIELLHRFVGDRPLA
jgi:UDP-N-acetylglucosamine transferase subunit ALG13